MTDEKDLNQTVPEDDQDQASGQTKPDEATEDEE